MNGPALSVVCWKWRPHVGYRSVFTAEAVNTLRRMVARHYSRPHRFICVTDDPAGLDPAVEYVPLWNDYADLRNPCGHPRNPSCYRRLRLFHPDAAQWFGERFVSLDLDTVVVGDLGPLWDRPEDFVIWGDTARHTLYNGSMLLLRAGARAKVWTEFNPATSPRLAVRAGQFGSDQGWIGYCLGPGEVMWTAADGVLSFRNEILRRGGRLPAGARIVMFHGQYDPWSPKVQRSYPWVKEAYR
jgi:hypothetical protein